MRTKRLTKSEIGIAGGIIRRGGVVAFPTETVYGLGANALDADAVEKIFTAKGRPSDNPLIVHVSSISQVKPLVRNVSRRANLLMRRFWPGPLSIVFPKTRLVPDNVTAGLDTVAIRMPDNKIALELIEKSGVPIAAPSANFSGRPSPTQARHVLADLDGKIDAVIDGGDCRRGLESTVIDVRHKVPVILRLGSITVEQIEKEIGRVRMARPNDKVRSPGMKYRHYAPKGQLILVEGERRRVDRRVQELISDLKIRGKKVELVSKADTSPHRLYARLRQGRAEVLIAKGVKEVGLGRAVMDRLRRAASRIERV